VRDSWPRRAAGPGHGTPDYVGGSRPAEPGPEGSRGFRTSSPGARGVKMSSPGARGFSRGAQGVQVNPQLNPLPVAPCRRPSFELRSAELIAVRFHLPSATLARSPNHSNPFCGPGAIYPGGAASTTPMRRLHGLCRQLQSGGAPSVALAAPAAGLVRGAWVLQSSFGVT
jgi:hypothetical protein